MDRLVETCNLLTERRNEEDILDLIAEGQALGRGIGSGSRWLTAGSNLKAVG